MLNKYAWNNGHHKLPLNEAKTDLVHTFMMGRPRLKKIFTASIPKNTHENPTNQDIKVYEYVIDFCFGDNNDELKNDAKTVFANILEIFEIIDRANQEDKNVDYADEEYERVEKLTDEMAPLGVKCFGANFMTNYIHTLAAGHMLEYMKLYKNLYPYSQQAWEACNASMQRFFRSCAKRGNHNGTGRTYPLFLWGVRRIFTLCCGVDNTPPPPHPEEEQEEE